jgi:hypothetical protein
MTDMQTVAGGCHCGMVRYEAEADLGQAMACNCSHCEKKGFILTFTPAENFRLLSGEDRITEYGFNQNKISHRFCAVCGTQPFAFADAPDGKPMAAINVRCIDSIDLAALTPQPFDGKSI